MLAYACGEVAGAALRELDAPAAAVEMMHAYSLVHDDLPAMDDDDVRRGRAACHIAFDYATAILAGDALQTHAFATLAAAETIPPHRRLQMVQTLALAAGAHGMAGGQMWDIGGGAEDDAHAQSDGRVGVARKGVAHENVAQKNVVRENSAHKDSAHKNVARESGAQKISAHENTAHKIDAQKNYAQKTPAQNDAQKNDSLAQLSRTHRAKTGALIAAAARIGALASARADEKKFAAEFLAPLEEYAQCVGLAFQIADDVLDETAPMEITGKRGGGDRRMQKCTYASVLGVDAARDAAREQCARARRAAAQLDGDASFLMQLAEFAVERGH